MFLTPCSLGNSLTILPLDVPPDVVLGGIEDPLTGAYIGLFCPRFKVGWVSDCFFRCKPPFHSDALHHWCHSFFVHQHNSKEMEYNRTSFYY